MKANSVHFKAFERKTEIFQKNLKNSPFQDDLSNFMPNFQKNSENILQFPSISVTIIAKPMIGARNLSLCPCFGISLISKEL